MVLLVGSMKLESFKVGIAEANFLWKHGSLYGAVNLTETIIFKTIKDYLLDLRGNGSLGWNPLKSLTDFKEIGLVVRCLIGERDVAERQYLDHRLVTIAGW